MPEARGPDRLSIVVYSGTYERAHYALAMASAALAVDTPVTMFFTMEASRAILAGDGGAAGWTGLPAERDGFDAIGRDADYGARGVARFEELLGACVELGAEFMVCEMGLRAAHLENRSPREDVPVEPGGLVTFLNNASATGRMLMV